MTNGITSGAAVAIVLGDGEEPAKMMPVKSYNIRSGCLTVNAGQSRRLHRYEGNVSVGLPIFVLVEGADKFIDMAFEMRVYEVRGLPPGHWRASALPASKFRRLIRVDDGFQPGVERLSERRWALNTMDCMSGTSVTMRYSFSRLPHMPWLVLPALHEVGGDKAAS